MYNIRSAWYIFCLQLICFASSDNTDWTRIQQNSNWTGPLMETKHAGNELILSGKIKIPLERCCPIVFIGSHVRGLPLEKGLKNYFRCLDVPIKHLKNILPYMTDRLYPFDWKISHGDHGITCKLNDDKTSYTLYGKPYGTLENLVFYIVNASVGPFTTSRNVYPS